MTPSQAKNAMRKALLEIVDPEPSKQEKERLWKHFESKCAYCCESLNKDERKGHIDHLVSCSKGGRNHISNRVLSCNKCNGDEKREQEWESFMKSKPAFLSQHKLVRSWVSQFEKDPKPDEHLLRKVNAIADKLIRTFNAACIEVRALRSGSASTITFPLVGVMRNDRVKELMRVALEKGFLTMSELEEAIPQKLLRKGKGEFDAIVVLLKSMDIKIIDE